MIEVDKMGIMMLKKFVKYVSQNMLGMVGMSVYILADTYFISVAVGTDGITALNLVLPVYNMIFAIGAMMGVGSAIRLVIERNQEHPNFLCGIISAMHLCATMGIRRSQWLRHYSAVCSILCLTMY